MNIDHDIAENVMKWKYTCKRPQSLWLGKMHNGAINVKDWKPSTNIKHAMEVEAEMFRRGFTAMIDRDGEKSWLVSFVRKNYPHSDALSKTLPEAICLAALEAVK